MKLTVKREDFLRNLELVKSGLATRSNVQQSTCFAFINGRVMTFNGEDIACRIKSGMPKDVNLAVPGNKLLTVLQMRTDEEVGIEQTNGSLIISGKGERTTIGIENEIFLPYESVSKPADWKPLGKGFSEALDMIHGCASDDEKYDLYRCVHIAEEWLEATDGKQAARHTMKTGFDDPVLVKSKSVAPIVALGMTQVSVTDNWVHFRNSNNLVHSCRRYLESDFQKKYLDLSKVLTQEGEPITIPKGLLGALKLAQEFTKEIEDRNKRLVQVHLVPGSPGRMKVSGIGVMGNHTGSKKIHYSGPELEFRTYPEILINLIEKHRDCHISENKMCVQSGGLSYATVIGKVEKQDKDDA